MPSWLQLRDATLATRAGEIESSPEVPKFARDLTVTPRVFLCTLGDTRGCCVPPKKRGEEARGFSTVRGAPQNGDGRFRDHAPDGSAALQNLYFFSNVAPKNLENAENAQKKRSDPKSPGLPWRCGGRLGVHYVGTGRIRAADRPKNFNRFESHTQHRLMRTKVVASSPICKSSVVDLVMSRDHQNDNAVWLCRFTKKKWSKEKGHGAERVWTDDHSLQSQRSTTSAISESTKACEKNFNWIM